MRSLLVVDDNADNRDLLSRRLKRAGFPVSVADGGLSALQILEDEDIDLVLLDAMMPGMSGLDLLRLLRATRSSAQLPVIMVTAVTDSDKVVEALNHGANDYITKPIDFAVALARIQSQLSRKRAEEALRESEERYSLAARGANDGLWDWDLRTDSVYYSPRLKEMLSLSANEDDATPEVWRARIHPSDRGDFEAKLLRLRNQTAVNHFMNEQRLVLPDGGTCWMLVRGHVLRDAAGAPVRMAGSCTDVTGNKSFDSLTGLPNRSLLAERISRAMEGHRVRQEAFALLFLDLDRFKVVNDSLGHLAGDRLLVAFAQRLQAAVRDGWAPSTPPGANVVARMGGDEFAVLLEDLRDPQDAEVVANRVLASMQTPFVVEGRELFTSASIGLAIGDDSHFSPDDLLRDADTALYRAKALGRARCHVFSADLRDAAVRRLELESDLRRAIDNEELRVHYQPKISLESHRLVGFEALLRWYHPVQGVIMPGDFIPLAEETGLILPIGTWILREAGRQLRAWQTGIPSEWPLEVSVNLSPKQFRDPTLISVLRDVLIENDIPHNTFHVEITEGVLIEDQELALHTLNQITALGIGIKLDDFGTGYSSLDYLCKLPCDSLKIDRSFVMRMCEDGNSLQVVRAIIALAQNLRMHVTAEGIESLEQATRLRQMGCDFGQGYYFAKPLPPEIATQFAREPGLVLASPNA
jgi:diguanylate cyclase (GGDEF)-like protein/PAS domain S-box-containing protein